MFNINTNFNSFSNYVSQNEKTIRKWAIFLILTGALLQMSYVFSPLESLPHRPFEEDTFFHLSVCRNLAMGKGVTIDGSTPTSGAQPGTLIYTLAYLLLRETDNLETLRYVRVVALVGSLLSSLAIFTCAFALFIKDKTNRLSLALLSCGLWTISYQAFRTNLNGYETPFAASALLFSVAAYSWRISHTNNFLARDFIFGVSLAIAIYARIDLGGWALCSAVCFVFISRESLIKKFFSLFIWSSTALLLTLPFWIHNINVGNSLMPISGKASAFQMTFHGFWESVRNCLQRGFNSIGEFGFISLYLPYSTNGNILGTFIGLIGVFLILSPVIFCNSIRQYFAKNVSLKISLPVVLFLIFIFSYYSFAHGSWWFMRRYMHPERAIFFTLSAFYILGISFLIKNSKTFSKFRYKIININLLLILAISFAQFFLTFGDTSSNQMYPVSQWINRNLPQESKIGAFQSGTLGYFCKNVINLDGKNNPQSLDAMMTGNGLEYIQENNIEYIVDWPSQIAKYLCYQTFRNEFEPHASVGASVIYKRRNVYNE
jgi:hypothetical protein